ncbi:hypothetical protein QTQ03_02250 [Micromonospora sp. WMMA1363]|uniref:hypothetical protein n=1 Tax=Micromonospora sp. WMMA1363 TaxID=3053985 RepID=UPI00259D1ADD|nr:hypothetical protein [Micromonospora sp. WMMA1363]MDM4718471.1 hypothetical protein [Micromonospora sp. WMMA1363]
MQTQTTTTTGNPALLLRPFRAHRLYPAALSAVERTKAVEGRTAALALAYRIATEFEELTLRETADRIRLAMETAPEPSEKASADCE